jgi:two-component system sensor histidine kinase VicK
MRIKHLQTKILVGTIGLVVLLGLVMAIFVKTVVYEKLAANLEKRGVFIAKTVADNSVNPLLTENFFELDMMVRDLKTSEEDIEYIFIVNGSGDVVSHTFDRGFPTDLKKLNGAVNGRGYHLERLATEKGIILDFAVPLMRGRVGSVHVGMTETPIRTNVLESIGLLLGVIFVVLLIGCGLAVVFSAAITKPVKELAQAATAVGGGNLDYMIHSRGSDELGQLGDAFNVMIEKRKEAEQGLRTSEKQLRDITSNLAEGLYVMDGEGAITFMNPEAERLFGWTMDELNEKGAHNLVHFRRADGTALTLEDCEMHNVINTGTRFMSADEVFVRKDGTVFPISVVSSPIFEQGRAIASVTAFRDITQRKELEQEREQLIIDHMDALSQIKTLSGMLPICASCKRIRDDKGYWNQIEAYIQEHSEAEFSHGICPECAGKIYPKYYRDET